MIVATYYVLHIQMILVMVLLSFDFSLLQDFRFIFSIFFTCSEVYGKDPTVSQTSNHKGFFQSKDLTHLCKKSTLMLYLTIAFLLLYNSNNLSLTHDIIALIYSCIEHGQHFQAMLQSSIFMTSIHTFVDMHKQFQLLPFSSFIKHSFVIRICNTHKHWFRIFYKFHMNYTQK